MPFRIQTCLGCRCTASQVPEPARPTYVFATSTPGFDTVVHNLVAVKQNGKQDGQAAVKILVDTENLTAV